MNYTDAIISQYLASLEMLRHTITGCPEDLWDRDEDRNRSWHIAYHALFYTHLYLQDSLAAFTPWAKHRPRYERLDPLPQDAEPYDKATVLEYLAFCQAQVADRVPQVQLDGESGFHWLPFTKFELQLYNIRHIQQHTGELMERLGTRAPVAADWVARRHPTTT